jgi:uncharacterized protein (DUF433 family)
MSGVAVHGIVAGDESDIHDEPHVEGSRITVRYLHDRVEERGLRPETVADRHGLDLADVYTALAYYHDNPAEMTASRSAVNVSSRGRQRRPPRHLPTGRDWLR